MLPSTCVVVPTYWTRNGGEPRKGDAVYDHPTPLDGESTLVALLDSLETVSNKDFYLLVIVAVTGNDVSQAAERKVTDLLAAHPSIPSLVFGAAGFAWLQSQSLPHAAECVGLQGYARIRNLQLALPLALGSEAIVALDDDEIITDPEFLTKAVEPLGTTIDGTVVEGLSGHYVQEDGSIVLKIGTEQADSPNLFVRKAAIMNAATELLEGQYGNIVPTSFCFGGNMEFTGNLAAAVGFDPGITRGEDIDYLINALMDGRHFFLRKDLHIVHRPPQGGSYRDSSVSKLEQDIIRFMYEREKLLLSQTNDALHAVTAGELQPYPGLFLDSDIDDHATEALQSAGYAGDPREFVSGVRSGLPERLDGFLRFREAWPRFTSAMEGEPTVGERLLRRVRGI